MSRFSIVLPVSRGNRQPNQIQRFEDTLASVLRSRPRQAQIIVVHDGSYEDPHGLGSEIDWIVETSSNLASQFDLGVAASHGDLIMLIRPGVELDEGWESSIEEAFEDPQVGSLTPLIVPSSRPGRMTAAGVSTNAAGTRRLLGTQQPISNRSLQKLKPLGPSSHLAVYRRTVLSAIGRLKLCRQSHLVPQHPQHAGPALSRDLVTQWSASYSGSHNENLHCVSMDH